MSPRYGALVADEESQQPEHWEGEENIPGAAERHEHQPSDVDAMGKDKRRQVVGGQYGATLRKQLTVYGIFVAIVVVGVIAFLTVVSSIDNREMPLENTAPWTEATATQEPPRDIDFPRNGPEDTIPRDELGQAVPPPQPRDDADNGED
jgi:hypothetical protein